MLFSWRFFKRKYLNIFDDFLIHLKQLSLNNFFRCHSHLYQTSLINQECLFWWWLELLYFDRCFHFLFLFFCSLWLCFDHLSLSNTVSYSFNVINESIILFLSSLSQNFLYFLTWLHCLHNLISLWLTASLFLAFLSHRGLILISFFIDKEQLSLQVNARDIIVIVPNCELKRSIMKFNDLRPIPKIISFPIDVDKHSN